ncbi:DUF155-domain-containing protein [Backusella circina FSU 941]|nr:DUF155-domain-containing protein [Backusella circina FSU 941]
MNPGNKGAENDPKKKTAAQTKASAISKQVLKTTPIPQLVQSSSQKINKSTSTDVMLRGKPTQPLRSTKVSQKLVLFPQSMVDDTETTMKATLPVDNNSVLEQPVSPTDEQAASLLDKQWKDEQRQPRTAGFPLPIEWTFGSRTSAERMTKDERDLALLPRAAAYCTGEGYNLDRLRPFLRQHHRVSPRLYDECLYAAYHFPLRTLRPDKDNLYNIRVRSYTQSRHLHRSATTDEEEMDYDEDHFRAEDGPLSPQHRPGDPYPNYNEEQRHFYDEEQQKNHSAPASMHDQYREDHEHEEQHEREMIEQGGDLIQHVQEEDEIKQPPREPFKGGEVFIFDYGVVVFWNFRRAEELLMLEDFARFSIEPFRDNPDEDMQIEEIHFQYDNSQMKPRIFNDMITLKKTGRLGKNRTEITKINGQLFNLRMNVNLVSNVLDTPEIFWSEPSLQPMYNAIREYLEIPQRAKILNDRLRVISDLLSMLRDHLTNFGVEYQTLIIIYLIIIAVIVACVSTD